MSCDKWNPHAADLLGDRARLLGIAGIVLGIERELLAEHATRGVDVGDRQLGAVLHLAAEGRFGAGHRSGHGDGDVFGKGSARERQRRADCQADELE